MRCGERGGSRRSRRSRWIIAGLALILAACLGPTEGLADRCRNVNDEAPAGGCPAPVGRLGGDGTGPHDAVTRAELTAAFVEQLKLPATPNDYFTDDDASEHEDAINRAAAAGVALGCSETTFCPDQVVSRGVMAEFLVLAYDLPESDEDAFTDDDGTQFEAAINRIAAAGLVQGHETGGFGPMEPLTRSQMLSFISRARRL
jgi:hypothetical protein